MSYYDTVLDINYELGTDSEKLGSDIITKKRWYPSVKNTVLTFFGLMLSVVLTSCTCSFVVYKYLETSTVTEDSRQSDLQDAKSDINGFNINVRGNAK